MCLARNGVKIVSKSFSKEFYLHFLNQEKIFCKFDFSLKNTHFFKVMPPTSMLTPPSTRGHHSYHGYCHYKSLLLTSSLSSPSHKTLIQYKTFRMSLF